MDCSPPLVDPPPPSEPQPITLSDFLKTVGWVGTGGQAKLLIQSGEIHVNGASETRRRKKLQRGDRVQWGRRVASVGEEQQPS